MNKPHKVSSIFTYEQPGVILKWQEDSSNRRFLSDWITLGITHYRSIVISKADNS